MSQFREEERNFARFFLLNFKVSPDISRRYFDTVFPPNNLAQPINSNVLVIIKLTDRKKIISAIQLKILRSASGAVWPSFLLPMPKGTKGKIFEI